MYVRYNNLSIHVHVKFNLYDMLHTSGMYDIHNSL